MKYHSYRFRISPVLDVYGHRWQVKGSKPRWAIFYLSVRNHTRYRKTLILAITEAENKWKGELSWESAVVLMKLREQGCKMLPGWREALKFH